MNKRTILTLYKNEMLAILRDKKTVFMNIFIPVILYPLITILASQIMMSVQSSLNEQTYQIAIVADKKVTATFKDILSATMADEKTDSSSNKKEDSKKDSKIENKKDIVPGEMPSQMAMNSDELHIEIVDSENPSQDLKDKNIDAYIEVKNSSGENPIYKINFVSSNVNSSTVSDYIQERLGDYKEELRIEKLQELGVEYDKIWNLIDIEEVNHATKEQSIGSVLGGIIPLLLIMGLVNGASHTAIDTTAGEKERGTLETTFSFPVTRKEIITGKFSAVATMASISVLLNFLSIGLMGAYMYSLVNMMAPDKSAMQINLTSFLPAVLIMFLCVVLFAIFISAITLAIFSSAQNPKEAGLYATPIMLITILVSYIGFIPNLDLSLYTAVIPIVNVVLLIKSILIFEYDIALIGIVLASNMAFGFLSVALMYKMFEREDILFGEDSKFFRIFESRDNIKAGGLPTISEAVFLLTIGFMALIFVGSFFQLKFGFWGLLSIQISILALAIGYALYAKFDIKKMFPVKMPRFAHVVGSIFLWLGTLFFVILISAGLQKIFPESFESIEMIEELFRGKSLLSLIIVVAIAPAICEEVFFRGFMYSAFRQKMRPYIAMLIVSVFFGIYHMSLIKFFTTAILGFALNYSMHKSGSILTSSLMHFLNNSVSVLLLYYQDKLMKTLQMPQQDMSPEMIEAQLMAQTNPAMIIISIIIALVFILSFVGAGVILLNLQPKKALARPTDENAQS
ncbi:MAG: ABC transporter permease subunit/CPBP intramembrane protease [Peptostreptococcaceae bacterium]|nr:ABC transporter permease subunit/CPBP intramembrane protease [Peptostreptococcaceae bacterium]